MRDYNISIGGSRFEKVWAQTAVTWEWLIERLRTPLKTPETHEEYFKLAKAEQDALKDKGGFVGGALLDGKRGTGTVTGRDLITLDMDNIPFQGTEEVVEKIRSLGCSFIIYSTRKHTERKPRLRVLIPLKETVTADEYEPIARKVASLIGIDRCDPTTFQASRLMYWPTVSVDAPYVFEYETKFEIDGKLILGMYEDWQNPQEWPQVPGEKKLFERMKKKQENPESKPGLVGMFCRTYDIYGAIEKFLPGIYTESDKDDRLTYVEGSTSGGAVIYENGMFLYSHHATDPCSGLLVNAFDLVRLHKFGYLDADADDGVKATSLPSYKEMCRFVMADPKIQTLMYEEEDKKIAEAFDAPTVFTKVDEEDSAAVEAYNSEWRGELDRAEGKETPLNTIQNVSLIVSRDMKLVMRVWYDEFAERIMVATPVPWDPQSQVIRQWTDVDDIGLLWYIERVYTRKITSQKCIAGLNLAAAQNKVNPVRDYLEGVRWDGVPRVDTLLIKYLGAADTPYTRAVTRKMLVAAVARVCNPGIKFDNMLILVGAQGLGKSTLFRKLGKEWFSDSLTTFEGKEAAELIQGVWIAEVGELTAMNKQESNSVKQFLSKQDDQFRAAYGRRVERHPRKCIFVGTSNDQEFLKDTTGNRRFWPVNVGRTETGLSVFDDLTDSIVDQIWGEALMWFRLGETLYLDKELEKAAEEEQREHMILSGREGIIEDYLATPVPTTWLDMSDMERRQFLNGNLHTDQPLVVRDTICPLEIWVYCYDKSIGSMQRQDTNEIGRALRLLGWVPTKSAIKFGNFGRCRGFERG